MLTFEGGLLFLGEIRIAAGRGFEIKWYLWDSSIRIGWQLSSTGFRDVLCSCYEFYQWQSKVKMNYQS